MITLITVLAAIFLFGLIFFISSREKTEKEENKIEKKEDKEFERTEFVKQHDHDRYMEKLAVEKIFNNLTGLAKLEKAKHPKKVKTIIINNNKKQRKKSK